MSTDIPLDAFVRRLSTAAERLFFKNNCVLAPFFVGHKPDGEVVTLAIRADLTKDEEAARMRAIAAQLDLVRCAYVDEAWTARIAVSERRAKAEIAIMNYIGVKYHPNRRECVIVAAEATRRIAGKTRVGIHRSNLTCDPVPPSAPARGAR
jgi:hypothetical protein